MYKRVLIPLDGSSLAEQALPHAIAQAKQLSSGVDPAESRGAICARQRHVAGRP